jgi:hypothetical protein
MIINNLINVTMETTIKTPKIKEIEKVIYNPFVKIHVEKKVEILAMRSDKENLLRIDFIYQAPSYYHNGGWIQMSPDCFIRPCGSSTKLKLVKEENIPLAPTKHFFKAKNSILSYSLYFPALPENTTSIDIIECEGPGGNWFNFYGVSMETVKERKIQVNIN